MPINLVRNQRIYYRETEFLVQSRLTTGEFLFRTPSNDNVITLNEDQFRRALGAGDLTIPRTAPEIEDNKKRYLEIEIDALNDRDRKEMERAYAYVQGVLDRGIRGFTKANLDPILPEIARGIGDPEKPGIRTVQRWAADFRRAGGDIRALIPGHAYKGASDMRNPDKVRQITEEVILKNGSGTRRFSIAALHSDVQAEIAKYNKTSKGKRLPLVSYQYVYRVFHELDLYQQKKMRDGAKEAKLEYHPVGYLDKGKRPLDIVEIDHTPMDFFVVDEETGLPMGRPWLTVAIDRATRMIVGFYIGFRGPSYDVVAECLRHAILPKDYVKDKYPLVENTYLPWGRIRLVIADKGSDFTSAPIDDAALVLNFKIEWTQRRTPWHKGHVERFFGTLSRDLLHTLTGGARPLAQRWDEEKPEKDAAITLRGLHLLVHLWVIDYYSFKPHAGLGGIPPHEKWKDLASCCAVEPFSSLQDLDMLLGRRIDGVGLTKYGIRYKGLIFQGDFITELRVRPRKIRTVTVKLLEHCKSIAVLDPDEGRYRTVFVAKQFKEYAEGLAWHQHEVISRHAREKAKSKQISIELLCQVRAWIRKIALSALVRPTAKGKAMIARFLNLDKEPLAPLDDDFITIEHSPSQSTGPVRAAVRTKTSPPPVAPTLPPPPIGDEDEDYAEYAKTQAWKVRKS